MHVHGSSATLRLRRSRWARFGARLGVLLVCACQGQSKDEPKPSVTQSVVQDAQSERQTVQQMLAVLEQDGLAFDANQGAAAELPEGHARAVLELQTTLQTEIELLRRELQRSEASSGTAAAELALLGATREALDRRQLGAFIQELTRTRPQEATPLFTKLEAQIRASVGRRLQRLQARP